MRRRRVLLVSYHFPPVGGAGVQRPAKFAKYLPQFGWDVTVLRASNPSVPLLDPSLLDDLPTDLAVITARTLEPGYAAKATSSGVNTPNGHGARASIKRVVRRAAAVVLQPDPQVLWLPAARRAALAHLRAVPHHAILATAPSYSNLWLGAMLGRRTNLPFLADYRDEWDLSSAYWENAPRDSVSRYIQGRMQRKVLQTAEAVIATTQASTARLAARAAEAGASPLVECIYNGWDPGDLQPAIEQQPFLPSTPGRFRLVYTGTLWNLTSIAPVVAAVERLAAVSPELASRLDLVVLGRKTPDQSTLLERIRRTPATLHTPDYAPHSVALATMASADALLLLLSDVPGADRVAPAKLFEYLAAGKPMLAVTPDGETAGIVREFDPDGWRSANDVAGVAEWLSSRLTTGSVSPPGDPAVRDRYQRRAQSGQLAALLDRIVEDR